MYFYIYMYVTLNKNSKRKQGRKGGKKILTEFISEINLLWRRFQSKRLWERDIS